MKLKKRMKPSDYQLLEDHFDWLNKTTINAEHVLEAWNSIRDNIRPLSMIDFWDIPTDILEAERKLSAWMDKNGYDEWELGGCKNRFSKKLNEE